MFDQSNQFVKLFFVNRLAGDFVCEAILMFEFVLTSMMMDRLNRLIDRRKRKAVWLAGRVSPRIKSAGIP